MTVSATAFFVETGAVEPFDGGFRVTVLTDVAFGPNEPIRAWVGAQELDMISPSPLGAGFTGRIDNQPAAGDTLAVQIGDQDRDDTTLTASDELDDGGGIV